MASVFKKLLQAALFVGFGFNVATAYDLSKKTTITVFKGFGKYPYSLKLNQFSNEVDLILYGCLDSNEDVKLVKTAQDYENLVPVQLKMGFPDNGIKMEKTYSGFNETYLTKAANSTLRFVGLLPSEDYKKDFKDDFLMKEYKKGQPVKFVLPSLEHFNVLKNYLLTKLESEEMDHPSQKPLLLIELEGGDEIAQADLDALSKYFEVANPNDADLAAFFNKNEEKIYETVGDFKDFFQVGQSFGEMVMQSIDKDLDKGDAKKLTIRLAKILLLGITIVYIENKIKSLTSEANKQEDGLFGWIQNKFFNKQPAAAKPVE